MSVLVRMPHTEVHIFGDNIEKLVALINDNFENVEVIEDSTSIDTWDEFNEFCEVMSGGDFLYAYRQKFGWTQEKVGKQIGKSKQYISDLENNRREITKNVALKLAEIFNTNYKEFL